MSNSKLFKYFCNVFPGSLNNNVLGWQFRLATNPNCQYLRPWEWPQMSVVLQILPLTVCCHYWIKHVRDQPKLKQVVPTFPLENSFWSQSTITVKLLFKKQKYWCSPDFYHNHIPSVILLIILQTNIFTCRLGEILSRRYHPKIILHLYYISLVFLKVIK